MCTTTGARFSLNFHIFYVNVDSDPEAEFALENLNIISTSSWYASVHELLEEFHIFYVKEGSSESRSVRTGNLDIIPPSCMAVFMAARRF